MIERLRILKINIKNSFYEDIAYIASGWGNIVSVIFFMISNIVFIDVIFQNINTIAGYTRDEVLLFNLMSQLWFFFTYNIFIKNLEVLNISVNTGQLDLILTKPVPSLFYVVFRNINVLNTLRDGIPSFAILILAINWNSIQTSPELIIIGLLIAILGITCSVCINFIAALPVFWTGNNQGILDLLLLVEDNTGHSNFVYEIWGSKMRIILITIFPTAISTALSTSVILGKQSALQMLLISIIVTICFLILLNTLWKLALKSYSSASS